jgi:hypothetical protein
MVVPFQVVYNVTVEHEGVELNYEKLCAHWNSYCYDNDILRLDNLMKLFFVAYKWAK